MNVPLRARGDQTIRRPSPSGCPRSSGLVWDGSSHRLSLPIITPFPSARRKNKPNQTPPQSSPPIHPSILPSLPSPPLKIVSLPTADPGICSTSFSKIGAGPLHFRSFFCLGFGVVFFLALVLVLALHGDLSRDGMTARASLTSPPAVLLTIARGCELKVAT